MAVRPGPEDWRSWGCRDCGLLPRRGGFGEMVAICSTRAMGWAVALVIGVFALAACLSGSHACTTMVVGRKASTENAPMCTHNDDCLDCDFRVDKTPAAEHGKHAMRDVYLYRNRYPTKVVEDRAPAYRKQNLVDLPQKHEWKFTPIGEIKQVGETYGLVEGGYGIMNDQGLAIGESTCAAPWGSLPLGYKNGSALFAVDTLMMLALERTSKARDAIRLMGSLAEEYGFYVEDFRDLDLRMSGGEALTVIDEEEAWVMHLACDPSGKSAIWAAQRVPDDHFAIIANQFIIRRINPKSDDFLYSSNMWDVAKSQGLWSETDGLLDWTRVFSLYLPGDSLRTPYSTLRQYALLKAAQPTLDINIKTDWIASDYPFSVKPARKLSARDLMEFSRNQFEGTEYDLTQGPGSGAHGNPDRYDGGPVDGITREQLFSTGGYPRGTSIHRTIYSMVAQSRGATKGPLAGPLLWMAFHAPRTSIFSPIYVNALEMSSAHSTGSMFNYDSGSMWWAGCRVSNYGKHWYRHALPHIVAAQDDAELSFMEDVERLDQHVAKMSRHDALKALTAFTVESGDKVLMKMHSLFDELVTYFHDGAHLVNQTATEISFQHLFYPLYWLKMTNFFVPPLNHPVELHGAAVPDLGGHEVHESGAPNDNVPSGGRSDLRGESGIQTATSLLAEASKGPFALAGVVVILTALGASFFAGSWFGKKQARRDGYASLA
ncbi:putative dipeptidase [Porphyridium purpureum]|uniref:Putative dipeptidase n=1 Tax=Porphyridium purpureum TaxID=35688 RepID=A0A5J4Z3L6_PORPP|nr:putative dipeptidase [Porphyridium purpureum]|eukprot:POR3651..scf295_1